MPQLSVYLPAIFPGAVKECVALAIGALSRIPDPAPRKGMPMRLLAFLLMVAASAALGQPLNGLEIYQRGRQQQLVDQCVAACGKDGNCQARCLSAPPPAPPPQAQPQRRQPIHCITDRSGYTYCQ